MVKSNRERLREIVAVLASYGFGHIYRTRIRSKDSQIQDAVNFRKAFEELGPSFIKIGQIVSTRRDLLPEDYIKELSHLQDRAPAFPFEKVKKIFEEDLHLALDEVFLSIDTHPLASASVAQVHRARLITGEEVILKVQRPEIEENLLRDIQLFSRVVSMAPGTVKEILVDPEEAFKEIKLTTKRELDFRNEANAIIQFKELNKHIAAVSAPKPFLAYTSKRILVEEYVEGIKGLNQTDLIQEGYILKDIAEKLILAFLSQVFKDGFFHGDPHPGNILIGDKKIHFIDFGIVGNLSSSNKDNLVALLKNVIYKDIDGIMNLLLQMAITKEKIKRLELYEDLTYIFDAYISRSFSQINISVLFSDILQITRKHKMTMPNDFIILVKSFTVMEGVVTELYPEINIMEISKEYVKVSDSIQLVDPISKEKLIIQSSQFLNDSIGLPTSLKKVLDNITSGRTKFYVELANFDDKWTGLNKMVNRVVFAVIIASLILSSAIIIALAEGAGFSFFAIIIFLGAGLMGLWLLVSIIKSGTL
ncbi:ABC1 kinase family protein [Lacticigenium naphthae]|uniref:ABC1 kinase family protein n=1 Tax=Lacticigenium naphthae TaxID=515351 RepID=UPI000409D660|nr:lipopolysaccharide core heptose(II) kinase RfaY [Lacticigenium naphthae]